jgi:hypothetical protein
LGFRGAVKALFSAVSQVFFRAKSLLIGCGNITMGIWLLFLSIPSRIFFQAMEAGKRNFKLVLQFDTEARSESQQAIFDQALRLAYKFSEHSGLGVNVAVEEVHNFSSPHFLPHWLEEIALTGRRRSCSA